MSCWNDGQIAPFGDAPTDPIAPIGDANFGDASCRGDMQGPIAGAGIPSEMEADDRGL